MLQNKIYKPRNNGLGIKAKSVQNLMEISFNKTERMKTHGFKLSAEPNKTKAPSVEKKIDYRTITRLSTQEPAEIIMQLVAPKSGLKEFLSHTSIDFMVLECFLKVLKMAIGCTTNHQNLIHLLSQFQGSTFLKQVLPFHIFEHSRTSTEDKTFLFFENTLILLEELVQTFPSSSFTEVKIVETLLEKSTKDLQSNGKTVPADVQQKLSSLQTLLQHLQQKKQKDTLHSDNSVYIVGNRESITEDFRSLSIYPTFEDIYMDKKVYMPPNIINGSYPDAQSYLDTHFRLLREDFIRPLRDGISQLVNVQNKELAEAKIDDIRIYFNTQILSPVCTNVGIVHEVKFDICNLSQVRWENSRRLLYGALVCLSKDNFNKMFFATVADRSVRDLEKGIITLMFSEESRQALASYNVNYTFLMVEATAYFEAYRHVLEGLKEMVDTEIPFQNYIVHCDTVMCPPHYLSENRSGYSIEKLLKHSNSRQNKGHLNIFKQTYKSDFDVLRFNTWPTKEDLELDESQYEAFRMSLTSELAIVQGPPGTGKTYVGLKIIYTLLENSAIWKTGKNPILVVCYTNHALDQFLEGILKYVECDIVRVGSRSSSEILQERSLSKIRSKKSRANLPGYMRAMHAELSEEKKTMQCLLSEKSCHMQNATKGVLHENTLEKYIPTHHFTSLTSKKEGPGDPRSSTYSFMVEWLGVSAVHNATLKVEDTVNSNFRVYKEEPDEDLIKINMEAEHAEAERMIDDEDDIKQQILMARKSAAQFNRNTLAFVPEELDNDNSTDQEKGWQISKDMKKKVKKMVKRELEKTTHMEETECSMISNLWLVPQRKRWEMYRWWRSKYLTDIKKQLSMFENLYQIVVNRMNELRNQEDLLILEEADIIGMTTTGAAKYRRLLQNIKPKIVIVEEAAEVLEAHIITTLSSACQHLILIGDHQQLRPSTTVYDLAKNFNLDVSMFERLVRMNVPYVRLNYQHRMRPEIARLLTPSIYDKLENHESVENFPNIKGVASNLFFLNHNHTEEHIKEGRSHQNSYEAAFVKCLCLYLLKQGYEPSQITILTTYSGQLHCLQKMMPKSTFEGVRVCVVDKYQGEENDIIILSLVRSNSSGNVGFLKIPNRVCVALSRAKQGLFCVGNMEILSTIPLWSIINDVLKKNGQIGHELKLHCENHPGMITFVYKAEDFKEVPEGGCMKPCEYRLPCGHACELKCHPYDSEHKMYECRKHCTKILCETGHNCKKMCFEPCGKCQVLVPKRIKKCGHVQDVPCSVPTETFDCKFPCPQILKCGHKCMRCCSDDCTRNCPEKLTVSLDCGHTHKTLCSLKSEAEKTGIKLRCPVKCQNILPCGHLCPGNCSSCSGQGLHLSCKEQCDITLLCSHRCKEKCSSSCFCIYTCERKCFHGKCPSKCIDPCPPCTEQCGWCCAHKTCTKLCWEPCDRKPCNKPCKKKLKCKHECIGLCGEPCPKKCRICDAEELSELFIDRKVDPEARFIELKDCSHIFEITMFTQWMNQVEQDQVIKLKVCPNCSMPIWQSVRFGNIIKQTFADLEAVKEKITCKWMNHLEIILSENESVLRHFPVIHAMQELQEGNATLHKIALFHEKMQLWIKLSVIKEKFEEAPLTQSSIDRHIAELSRKILNAKSRHDVFQIEYGLYRLVLQVQSAVPDKNMSERCIQHVQDLYIEMNKTNCISLDELKYQLRSFSVNINLIQLIEAKKTVLDTDLLKQGRWHKCPYGHIYASNKDEDKKGNCPQCGDDDDLK
ncbi:hypothetical protein GDO86_011395 [Hymenochirus boettgeri]|uniref:NFX1-type zinc finger-containing protein 1 n=1 Tax=Hymenochirus boettgeri TaxID=247094 RepID=A0A8T2JJC1_9PIPI|nr:hypothetical protein GDO86_011395 [Hymenochirus boettgeri]